MKMEPQMTLSLEKKFSCVIPLKVNTQNIYPEVLDQIWSIYICENYINVSLNQRIIINIGISNIITGIHVV